MESKAIRAYAETSVYGGVVSNEFKKASANFFKLVRQGHFKLVTSALVENELIGAPDDVREVFYDLLSHAELIEVTSETIALQRAYMKSNILTPKWEMDALHVALASVSNCAIIVSWNFKHIVNFRKIPLYNAVNQVQGYKTIAIYSPLEVIADGK